MDVYYTVTPLSSLDSTHSTPNVYSNPHWTRARVHYLTKALQVLQNNLKPPLSSKLDPSTTQVLILVASWEESVFLANQWSQLSQGIFPAAHKISYCPKSEKSDERRVAFLNNAENPKNNRSFLKKSKNEEKSLELKGKSSTNPWKGLVIATPRMLLQNLMDSKNVISLHHVSLLIVDHLEAIMDAAGPDPMFDLLRFLPYGIYYIVWS